MKFFCQSKDSNRCFCDCCPERICVENFLEEFVEINGSNRCENACRRQTSIRCRSNNNFPIRCLKLVEKSSCSTSTNIHRDTNVGDEEEEEEHEYEIDYSEFKDEDDPVNRLEHFQMKIFVRCLR